MTDVGEKQYYQPLCEWLQKEKEYYCGGTVTNTSTKETRWYANTGTRRQIADVIGIRNVGTELVDDIEILVAEVRDKDRITLRDLQDARGYSRIAHRCYLASTAEPTKENQRHAERLGVGLIQISGVHRFSEILPSQRFEPSKEALLELLDNLWVAKCTICQCYVLKLVEMDQAKGWSYAEMKRARQFDYELLGKGITAFDAMESGDFPKGLAITRYICRSCVRDLTERLPKWASKMGAGK